MFFVLLKIPISKERGLSKMTFFKHLYKNRLQVLHGAEWQRDGHVDSCQETQTQAPHPGGDSIQGMNTTPPVSWPLCLEAVQQQWQVLHPVRGDGPLCQGGQTLSANFYKHFTNFTLIEFILSIFPPLHFVFCKMIGRCQEELILWRPGQLRVAPRSTCR